jgi:uncharacterized protein (DUF952 family)
MKNPILHIVAHDAWMEAVRAGEYRAPSLDTEGFIHCSYADQIVATAQRYYRGQARLALLEIDPARLRSELRVEALGTPEPYPHIYGPLNLDAVIAVHDFPPLADGSFRLPSGVGT